MRLLLVDPPGKNKGLNTGLGYLSAMVKEKHEIYVLDLNNIEMGNCGDRNKTISDKEIESKIANAIAFFKPQIFGVSIKTFTSVIAKDLYQKAKSIDRNLITVAGGPHITLDGIKYISENRIDFGIAGEGEIRFNELCRAIENGSGWDKIDGVYFWENGFVRYNEHKDRINDLDGLPYPDYTKFSSVIENGKKIDEYPLLTSRGCPYGCEYCSMPKIMGKKWRAHTAERVVNELKNAKIKYGCKSFTVVDDNFTLKLERVEKICDKLLEEKLNLPWNSQNGIRADRINEVIAKKMRTAGCKFVWIGIESADEYVFDKINKGEKLEDIERGIAYLQKAGIRVGGFFITGLPYSSRKSDLKSVQFVKEHRIEGWWFNYVPYPHTKSYEWVKCNASNILKETDGILQFGSSSIEPVFETDGYKKEERIQTYREIHVLLKYFDRLSNDELKPVKKWMNVYETVKPYGNTAILHLIGFILKHGVKKFYQKIKRY